MENLVFTQLSIPEIKKIFRQELEDYFATNKQPVSSHIATDHLLTIKQAAEILSLSVPTIYGLVNRNEIPYMKKTKRLYFSKAELFDWVKAGRKKTISQIEAEADVYLQTKRKK